MADALAAVEATVEECITCLTARDTRSAARDVLNDVLLTVADLVGEVDTWRAWFLLVTVVRHLGMPTSWWRSNAGEVATHLRAARDWRLQHCAATMADELFEASLKTWWANATMTRHGTVVKPAGKRFRARYGTLVQASRVHCL